MPADKGIEALKRGRVQAHRNAIELSKHAQQLAPVFVVAARRQRHRHDATQQAGPEHFDEALVVAEVQDQHVPAGEPASLQAAQRANGSLPQSSERQRALIVFSFDEGDLTILSRVGGKKRI